MSCARTYQIHMYKKISDDIILNLKNIPGWRSRRKIVVFECDDFGGIRMPSASVFYRLKERGLNISTSRFNIYDTLESGEDLEQLYEVLLSVKDQNNSPAVFTPVTIMANPDFDRIRSAGFNEYYYETFDETLKRYYPGENVFETWKQGIRAGIFIPELHGRDHITVQFWLRKLREGDKDLLFAFDNNFVSLRVEGVPSPADEFRAEFYFSEDSQKHFLEHSIHDAAEVFERVLGYRAHAFIPGNGIFHPSMDKIVASTGIRFLNVTSSMPFPAKNGVLRHRYFITGQKGPDGLTYYTRNCAFEPTDPSYKGTDYTLKQIEAAFRWRKPALISTHRVNFSGGISPDNRAKGLTELKKLLFRIAGKWPDVEFLSLGAALESMREN